MLSITLSPNCVSLCSYKLDAAEGFKPSFNGSKPFVLSIGRHRIRNYGRPFRSREGDGVLVTRAVPTCCCSLITRPAISQNNIWSLSTESSSVQSGFNGVCSPYTKQGWRKNDESNTTPFGALRVQTGLLATSRIFHKLAGYPYHGFRRKVLPSNGL